MIADIAPPPYGFYLRLRRWLGGIMPQKYSDDRLVFKLESDDPIELDKLGEGFSGLAAEFNRHLGASGIKPDVNAKLLVTRVKTGSIEFELATLMAFYMYMQQSADGFVIWADFYDRVRRTLLYLSGRGPKPDDYNREDARNFNAFLGTVSGKSGARLSMKRARYIEKTGEKEIIAEFDFNEGDIAEATAKVAHDVLEALPAPTVAPESHKTEIKVPFIWFRTDRDKGKATGQTSDRGIIAPLSDKPLPVYFASEIDSKERMIRIKNNPFDAVFIVDVSVRLDADGNPISYTIMNIHGTAEPKLLAQSED